MLFRKEVLDAKRGGWLGGISLAQPLGFRFLAWAAALAALGILLVLTFGSYTRRSRVEGQLQPVQGLATVVAPADGVVTAVDAAEGARVRKGQTLAVVVVPRTTTTAGDAGIALSQRLKSRRDNLVSARDAQTEAFDAQHWGLRAQLENAEQELRQIEAELETRRKQAKIADETVSKYRQLRSENFVSDLQLREQETRALEQLSELQSLMRQAATMRRQLAELRQSLKELPAQLRTTTAGFERDIAAVEQETVEVEARQALNVVSPLTGVVATQLAKPGQSVEARQPLATILPGDGELEAELLVPSRAIAFIEPGDTVLLRYHAYPYQKFGQHKGRVKRISRSALPRDDAEGRESEPYYRVVVAPDAQTVVAYGRAERLKPGMSLEADILGERRSLIEWIFEPLYSLKGNVSER